jgi:hypothetical protein
MILHTTPDTLSIQPHLIVPGEVFSVSRWHPTVQGLLREGSILEVPPDVALFTHKPTGRCFADPSILSAYIRDNECPTMRERYPRRYEPVSTWRMTRSVRVLPEGIELQQGEILSPTHPTFPLLYAEYVASSHPLMVPALVFDVSSPGAPADTSPEQRVMGQTPSFSAAFQLERKVALNGTSQWCSVPSPLVQAATVEMVKKLLVMPHWETVYDLESDTLPPDVPDLRPWVTPKGAWVFVRVRRKELSWPDSQYFQVQSLELLTEPLIKTEPLVRPSRIDRKRGRSKEPWNDWTRDQTLKEFITAAQRLSRKRLSWTRISEGSKPHIGRNSVSSLAAKHGITLDEIQVHLS